MLRNLNSLVNRPVMAEGGRLGEVKGFFFDDRQWIVRYLIVETLSHSHSRETIISTAAFKGQDWNAGTLVTDLSLTQVRNGPEVELDRPLAIAQEERIARYFGWPVYWNALGAEVHRATVTPSGARAMVVERESTLHALRGTREIRGFGIRAIDGEVGEIADLVADDASWQVHYLEIDTGTILSGKKVLLSPEWVESVDWYAHTVSVPLSKSTIKESPAYDPSEPITRTYEDKLFDYYKMPKYWRHY